MTKWIWCAVALALSCVSVIATDGMPSTEKITVATSKSAIKTANNVTTTSAPPSTTPPTAPTSPTTPPTTSATTTPKAPTPSTPPTASPTTTPKAPTPPTPPKPTPPTPPKPTPPTPPKPTPAPAPPQPPSTNVWNYTDGTTNITCIMVQFAVQFNITYATANGTRMAVMNLPKDSEVTGGSCGNTTQWIQLSWPANVTKQKQNTFTVKFELNSTTHQYHTSLLVLNLVYNASVFPDAASNASISLVGKMNEWYSGVSYSYRCKRPQILALSTMEATKGFPTANVTVSDVQEQAFRTEKGKQFGIAADCEVVDVPDVVPIAVGCALGGLVLVVLVAYMVGRRRSQARGYLSM